MILRSSPLNSIPLWGGLFLAYATASVGWSSGNKVWALGLLYSLAGAFALGFLFGPTKYPWRLWGWFMALNVCLSIPFFLISEIPFIDFRFGIFGNPNIYGCALVLALGGAIAVQQFHTIPFLFGGLVLSQSRGAIFAAGVTAFAALWKQYKATAFCSGVLAFVLIFEVSDVARNATIWHRLGIWQDTLNHLTPFGSGWGSFLTEYASWTFHVNKGDSTAWHVYNDVLELIFELGLGTIPLWIMLALCAEGTDPGARLILIAYVALSLSFFPLYLPLVGALFALALGQLAATRRIQWLAGA